MTLTIMHLLLNNPKKNLGYSIFVPTGLTYIFKKDKIQTKKTYLVKHFTRLRSRSKTRESFWLLVSHLDLQIRQLDIFDRQIRQSFLHYLYNIGMRVYNDPNRFYYKDQ